MKTDNTTSDPGADWQLLGELELPVRASVEDVLYGWLAGILHPLNLREELLNKIAASAQDAFGRAIHAETMLKFKHIHLILFVPSEKGAKEKAWGFFRLEKIEDAKEGQADGDHVMEFYLYSEGD